MRNMGRFPRPRCTIPKGGVHEIGTLRDDTHCVRNAAMCVPTTPLSIRCPEGCIRIWKVTERPGRRDCLRKASICAYKGMPRVGCIELIALTFLRTHYLRSPPVSTCSRYSSSASCMSLAIWKHASVQLLRMLMGCTTELNERYTMSLDTCLTSRLTSSVGIGLSPRLYAQ